MVVERCFDHVCPGEPDLFKRLRISGYFGGASAWAYGENIAWGETAIGTPRAIVRAWMNSPPHRVNVLNPRFDHIGVGTVWGNPARKSRFDAGTFTADFGYASR